MNPTSPTITDAPPPTVTPSRLAELLRWLGTGTLVLSGVVFLLQGLEHMEALRNWACLLLMALLTLSGVGAHAVLADARSARLLLGLAAALVPVQMAQLAGLVHELAAGGGVSLHAWSSGTAAAAAAFTLALGPLAAFGGFAVLVRPSARSLTYAFLLPNTLLLLPWRDSLGGFAVLAMLALLAASNDRVLARRSQRFATAEGRAARAILLIPAAIAAVRLGFHLETVTGYCALSVFGAVALVHAGRHFLTAGGLREMAYAAAATVAASAWTIWAWWELGSWQYTLAWWLVPVSGVLIAMARLSSAPEIYRGFGALLVALTAAGLLSMDDSGARLITLVLGLASLLYGCMTRERAATLSGVAVTTAAVAALCWQVLSHVDLNGWVTLAAAGILLVIGASVVERYGRTMLERTRTGWADLQQWS